ncbi:MAG: hypothetical protein WC525_04985 [Candidatus Thermoplasmatota archaeon]
MRPEDYLEKHIDVMKIDGFHVYGILKKIESYGIWVESNSELGFLAFSNIREIRPDRRYRGDL